MIAACRNDGIPCEENAALAPYTSMKIGGACDLLVKTADEKQLLTVLRLCRSENIPHFILGRGSNLLVSSAGWRGAVILLSGEKPEVEARGNSLTAWAGVPLYALCSAALEHSLTGLEFAYGIPGSLGGALYMNAGAYGGEMKDVVTSCRYVGGDGEIHEMSAAEMQLTYRHSVFSGSSMVITSVTMELVPGDKAEIKSRMEELMQRRRDKQPLNFPSCGSTFKRPDGYFAAALIEECGLKGFTIGGAQVSEKHSGFVINRGHATFEDVMAVVNEVKRVVLEKKGVELECEMLILQ
ncbi:MAG TPA: UDP-N-acetylenolpyruvoylglucosamine reductase [Ruminococcaceae bacterium]|nr:UDP-N-acetylenolpyruvoylglucosamine reductase [Oscillospiraceae bacterium]HCK49472.1 UDP-N-acetylenolpyruvoylglucosamine reductase [Oscillospiraceae bacterium]